MLVREALWQGRSDPTRAWNTRCSFSQIEVKESRNASSLLLIKLALMISDLDLFAIVSGHLYADERCLNFRTESSIGITPGKLRG